MMIMIEKKISRPTSCEDASVRRMIPAACSSGVASRYRRMMLSTITTAPSTMMPKSMAPRERRFAGIPVTFIMRNAKSMETGIVVATTSADRTLPIKNTKTTTTIVIPSHNVLATVSMV